MWRGVVAIRKLNCRTAILIVCQPPIPAVTIPEQGHEVAAGDEKYQNIEVDRVPASDPKRISDGPIRSRPGPAWWPAYPQ